MIKEIRVAGVTLGNYTTRESLMKIDKAFYEEKFTTVKEINMRSLFMAREDELVKQVIESVDVTVIAESGILDVAGLHSLHRKHEIDENEFFFQFFKRIERNNRRILLLGENENEINIAREYIQRQFPRVAICGWFTLENCRGDEDAVVNDINAEAADVIISVLPSPRQEYFLHYHRDKLLAKLWYGVGDEKFVKPKIPIASQLSRLFRVKKLMKYIKRYEKQKEI